MQKRKSICELTLTGIYNDTSKINFFHGWKVERREGSTREKPNVSIGRYIFSDSSFIIPRHFDSVAIKAGHYYYAQVNYGLTKILVYIAEDTTIKPKDINLIDFQTFMDITDTVFLEFIKSDIYGIFPLRHNMEWCEIRFDEINSALYKFSDTAALPTYYGNYKPCDQNPRYFIPLDKDSFALKNDWRKRR